MSRIAHVIQGLSAAKSFSQAMNPEPGELLVNEDVLSCGPLPPFRSIEEWVRLREEYWDWDSFGPTEDQRPFNRDLLANTQALRELDSIVVWVGVGAAEQLALTWMVQLLKLVGSQAQLHVVQFTRAGEDNERASVAGKPSSSSEHKEKGPRALRVVARVIGLNFDADLVGDLFLVERLYRLASPYLAHPLLALSGDPSDVRKCQVALTDAGETVLAARANAVELNGIDDWILGVHLDSESGSVWYHKEGTLVTR